MNVLKRRNSGVQWKEIIIIEQQEEFNEVSAQQDKMFDFLKNNEETYEFGNEVSDRIMNQLHPPKLSIDQNSGQSPALFIFSYCLLITSIDDDFNMIDSNKPAEEKDSRSIFDKLTFEGRFTFIG